MTDFSYTTLFIHVSVRRMKLRIFTCGSQCLRFYSVSRIRVVSPRVDSPCVVSPRKVSRFAPLNRYYILIDEVFFDKFLEIIYLLVVCKNNNNSFILFYFKYLFISCLLFSKLSSETFLAEFTKNNTQEQ
jgi:hypothetical protein